MRYIHNYLLKSDFIYSRNLSSLTRRLQSTTSENSLPIEDGDQEQETVVKKSVERNKSRLLPQHRNLLMGKKQYDEPKAWIHLTEKYQRKLFGKHGLESNIDPRICFYTKEQKELREEYERVAFPHTIREMMRTNEEQKEAKRLAIQKREDEIAKKFGKLEQWKTELNAKIAKKEADALEAKRRKERLVEEVRRHFGFTVDPRDERFKEMLEQKEKEDRKMQKEAKRKAKEAKMMAKFVESTVKNREAATAKTEEDPTTTAIENQEQKEKS